MKLLFDKLSYRVGFVKGYVDAHKERKMLLRGLLSIPHALRRSKLSVNYPKR